eukprot:scaffold654562_cov41-Prasinocladus_malaysianus.AAC.1
MDSSHSTRSPRRRKSWNLAILRKTLRFLRCWSAVTVFSRMPPHEHRGSRWPTLACRHLRHFRSCTGKHPTQPKKHQHWLATRHKSGWQDDEANRYNLIEFAAESLVSCMNVYLPTGKLRLVSNIFFVSGWLKKPNKSVGFPTSQN